MTFIGVVLLLHVGLGYAFVTGLALKAVKVITGPLETFEVEEPVVVEDDPPPPPPKMEDVPPYVPPPEVVIDVPPPPQSRTIVAQRDVKAVAPARVAPPAPPAPPPVVPARPKGRLGTQVTQDDYPSASIRAGEEGLTIARYTVGTNGRVVKGSCQIAQSSGYKRLDRRTCRVIERRFSFYPATRGGKPVESVRTQRILWQLPR